MTTETAVKKPALNETILAASKKLYEAMSIDSTTGIANDPSAANKEIESILYSNGVTKELATQYEANIETALVASTHAFGQRSTEAYQANKDLTTTEIVLSFHHKNKLSLDSLRSKEYPNPQNPEAPITKHVVIKHDYESVYDKNIGQLKIARTLIADLGAEALK